MYYAQIRKFDTANGTGIRSTLFVSGCTHRCKGCFNQDYKHFRYGHPWTKEVEDRFIAHLKNPNVHGVTILGGEPMDQVRDNCDVLVDGPFIEEQKDLTLRFKGSRNQRIIDIPKTFTEGKVVLLEKF